MEKSFFSRGRVIVYLYPLTGHNNQLLDIFLASRFLAKPESVNSFSDYAFSNPISGIIIDSFA